MIVLQIILELLFIILIEVAGLAIGLFVYLKISRYYREWRWRRREEKRNRRANKIWEEIAQRERRKQLREIDKKKYPLFYWKEMTDGDS